MLNSFSVDFKHTKTPKNSDPETMIMTKISKNGSKNIACLEGLWDDNLEQRIGASALGICQDSCRIFLCGLSGL